MQSVDQMTQVMLSHNAIEYGTPQYIIDAARQVLGTIDLDPASSSMFNQTVGAKNLLTVEQNGLRYNWRGNIWLNPPYSKTAGKSNQEMWANHLEKQYLCGNVSQALLLIRASLGYSWFESLWRKWPTCLIRERIPFYCLDGSSAGPAKYANAMLYFGHDYSRFITIMSSHGRIILP